MSDFFSRYSAALLDPSNRPALRSCAADLQRAKDDHRSSVLDFYASAPPLSNLSGLYIGDLPLVEYNPDGTVFVDVPLTDLNVARFVLHHVACQMEIYTEEEAQDEVDFQEELFECPFTLPSLDIEERC